ncbi:MAG TPA: DUF1109 domain-containing protein [Caulobacteraceae bacterium]|jgi:hypothetical protein
MKTSELIEALAATDSAPVRPIAPARRLVPAAFVGALASLVILVLWLGLQPLDEAAQTSWFWMKAGYGVAAALAGLALTLPLSRPGGRPGAAGFLLAAAALATIWMMAMHRVMGGGGRGLWLGHTWMVCPWRIIALAAPIWVAAVLAMRSLAPTRLAMAGAATGLLAGGLSVVVYGLYCQESAAPFVAVWYSLGLAVSVAAGAVLGPRLLRW